MDCHRRETDGSLGLKVIGLADQREIAAKRSVSDSVALRDGRSGGVGVFHCGGDVIVTFNLSDFPDDALRRTGLPKSASVLTAMKELL